MIKTRSLLAAIPPALFLVAACGNDQSPESPETLESAAPQAESFARSAPDAGGVERVKVQASGTGENVQVAIDRAIRLAYEQVNGKAFDAATASLDSEFKAQLGDMSLDGGVSGYADAIFTATSGSVSDFRLLSQEDIEDGVRVRIEASVEQFVKPASASNLRIAFSPFRANSGSFRVGGDSVSVSDVSNRIADSLSESLLGSKRVTVLDREFDAEIQKELSRIDADNWQNEDRLRLGQQLAADYLVVGRIDRFEYVNHSRKMRTTDRVITSWSGGAALTYQVINVATGEVVLADSIKTTLPETKPTTMGAGVDSAKVVGDLVAGLTTEPRKDIVLALFPITVVEVDGDMVALSQGGEAVEQGKEYQVVLRGKELTDPQTGQVIGRMERNCCTVRITNVTKDLTFGVIESKEIPDVGAAFKPGALELRGEVEQRVAQVVEQEAAPAVPPKNQPTPVVETNQVADDSEEPEEDPDW